jgi:hypothetical protein
LIETFHNLRYFLLSLGVLSSGNIRDDRGKTREIKNNRFITTKKIAYRIRISKHPVINEISSDMTLAILRKKGVLNPINSIR